jgi:hypothetical protein
MMDLHDLAARTNLPLRKLRYVIDHGLVPRLNLKLATSEVGRPRQLAQDAAFGVAWVAILLEGGMQRTTAKDFVAAILNLRINLKGGNFYRGHELLARFMGEGGTGRALLADGVHVRLRLTIHNQQHDTGWCERQTGAALAAAYSPRLIVESDLTRLRDEIFGSQPSAE